DAPGDQLSVLAAEVEDYHTAKFRLWLGWLLHRRSRCHPGVLPRILVRRASPKGQPLQNRSERHHAITRFRSLSGTKTRVTTRLPFTCCATNCSAIARVTISSSPEPAGALSRPRTRPLTCTTISTSSSRARSGLKVGQLTVQSPPEWPSISQSSSERCGV